MIAALGPAEATVIVAVIGAIPATIAAISATKAAQQAGAANRAVNDVGNDQPKLRDIVQRIDEAQTTQSARLDSIDGQLARGADRMAALETGVAGLSARLDRHLAWHQDEAEQGPRVAEALDLDDDGGQT